jgi:hypothetical protein
MAIKIMSRTKLTQSRKASLEKQLAEIERSLVVGIKDAISMLFTLDALHEIMDYCEELAAKWEDKPLDFTDDDLDSFDLDDDENEED